MTYIKVTADKTLDVPKDPNIGYIEGDGIGGDITKAMITTVNAAVEVAYGGEKTIIWDKIPAGEESFKETGKSLPQDSLDKLKKCVVSVKGPLTTPVGHGMRSLNVTLRQYFDLYANIRPVKYIPGSPSPVKYPEKMDMVVFRENTEDLYAGYEWKYDSAEAEKLRSFLSKEFSVNLPNDSGIGIKPISKFKSQRLVRKAIQYAIENHRKSVTLMHKGNIMKYTEGAFREWGYELAATEFKNYTVTEKDYLEKPDAYPGKIVIKDRIADNMFQQVLTRTEEYDVIATTNINGDYLSDALAAQVGGIGTAPSGNVGDAYAIFEAIHGSAPKYTGMDVANPTSIILSAAMALEYIKWNEAARIIRDSVNSAYLDHKVTQDIARYSNVKPLRCSEFAEELVRRMKKVY